MTSLVHLIPPLLGLALCAFSLRRFFSEAVEVKLDCIRPCVAVHNVNIFDHGGPPEDVHDLALPLSTTLFELWVVGSARPDPTEPDVDNVDISSSNSAGREPCNPLPVGHPDLGISVQVFGSVGSMYSEQTADSPP